MSAGRGTLGHLAGYLLAALAFLIAPSTQAQGLDVSGHLPDLTFSLRDDTGRGVTAATYRNQIVWLVFGFAGCGDACPTTLTRLVQTRTGLGADGQKVRVLFVSVTPRTDRPQALHVYLQGYGSPALTGLMGPDTRNLAKTLRAAFPVRAGDPPVHSNAVYVFDGAGHARRLIASANDQPGLITATREALQ